MKRAAVFFDKDGVLNKDIGLIENLKEYEISQHAIEIISYATKLGYLVFIATNQPVVARGLMTEKELKEYLESYRKDFLSCGAVIEKIYYCPHHPNATVREYRIICQCRKPKPGMLEEAKKEYSLDLEKSFFIGDRVSDIIAGNLVHCTTIQLMSEKSTSSLIETDLKFSEFDTIPKYRINSLIELKKYL